MGFKKWRGQGIVGVWHLWEDDPSWDCERAGVMNFLEFILTVFLADRLAEDERIKKEREEESECSAKKSVRKDDQGDTRKRTLLE